MVTAKGRSFVMRSEVISVPPAQCAHIDCGKNLSGKDAIKHTIRVFKEVSGYRDVKNLYCVECCAVCGECDKLIPKFLIRECCGSCQFCCHCGQPEMEMRVLINGNTETIRITELLRGRIVNLPIAIELLQDKPYTRMWYLASSSHHGAANFRYKVQKDRVEEYEVLRTSRDIIKLVEFDPAAAYLYNENAAAQNNNRGRQQYPNRRGLYELPPLRRT